MVDKSGKRILLEIDREAQAGYIRLRDGNVVETCEAGQQVLVDLDEFGLVLGIEVLSLTAQIPFDVLQNRFHVHSEDIEGLRAIQPTLAAFLSSVASFGSDSTINAGDRKLQAA